MRKLLLVAVLALGGCVSVLKSDAAQVDSCLTAETVAAKSAEHYKSEYGFTSELFTAGKETAAVNEAYPLSEEFADRLDHYSAVIDLAEAVVYVLPVDEQGCLLAWHDTKPLPEVLGFALSKTQFKELFDLIRHGGKQI